MASCTADIEQIDPLLVLAVETPHVRTRTVRLEHDGDAVQILMAGMKNVP